MKYQPIIGLEVHVELATESKMFCGCPANHFGVEPNTHTCPVCLGLPGALPVPNKKAIEWTIKLALALGCKINLESHFDRKNYFYPDLPKGYQITQYERPFGEYGKLGKIRIRRVHLEEDTGKLQHDKGSTLVDFNRSSVPLVEIVTEPDFRSLEEVDIYLKKLQRIIRYLGISNADMEKGSMRLEPSISLIEDTSNKIQDTKNIKLPNYRVELKNINSFRFVKKALEYEIERQQKEPHVMQTRGWDENKGVTFAQREKEEANDYRYFPEPDIPPVILTEFEIRNLKFEIPELPDERVARFVKEYGLSEYQANILADDVSNEFEKIVKDNPDFTAVEVANSIINKRPLVAKSNVTVSDEEVEKIVEKVLNENVQAVSEYKNGKVGVLGFLIGQAVKINKDIDKQMIGEKLREALV